MVLPPNGMCWRLALKALQSEHFFSFPNEVEQIRKLSLAYGIFHRSDQLPPKLSSFLDGPARWPWSCSARLQLSLPLPSPSSPRRWPWTKTVPRLLILALLFLHGLYLRFLDVAAVSHSVVKGQCGGEARTQKLTCWKPVSFVTCCMCFGVRGIFFMTDLFLVVMMESFPPS